jgi:YbgC/YbaW family acyl-CoA thioester hydrolase
MNPETIDVSQLPTYDYPMTIKEQHLDSFGHVNNAQYLVLFEEARWDRVTARGYGLKEVQKNQVGSVVLECSIRFRRELTLRERVMIRTKVTKLSYKMVTVQQEIIKENGKLGAEATFVMGCFDLAERKLIVPTQDWLAAVTGENL